MAQDPTVYTSIDDAFATLMQYMSMTTRQCKVTDLFIWCSLL